MKGIKDIILKGSIFAVLSAVFCVGCIPAAPLVFTVHAEEITSETVSWSGEMTLTEENDDVTIDNGVTLNGNTTLKVAEFKTLTINGSINCNNKTLTIAGPGTVTVNGGSEIYGIYQGENVTLESGTLNVTKSDNGGITASYVTITGGTLNVTLEGSGTGISTSEKFTITGDNRIIGLSQMAIEKREAA